MPIFGRHGPPRWMQFNRLVLKARGRGQALAGCCGSPRSEKPSHTLPFPNCQYVCERQPVGSNQTVRRRRSLLSNPNDVYAELLHAELKRRAMQSQPGRSAVRSSYHPFCLFQGRQNVGALGFFQGSAARAVGV
jgi:hypothetical protein